MPNNDPPPVWVWSQAPATAGSEFEELSDGVEFYDDEDRPANWESEWELEGNAEELARSCTLPSVGQSVTPESSDANGPERAAVAGRLSWVVATSTILLTGWLVGPSLVERYYYARTKGEMLAEYDIAKTALGDDPLANLSAASQWVSQKVKPSVVHIRTTSREVSPERLSAPWPPSLSEGQGSGVIVSSDGFILTNEHVIENADEIVVTLFDRRDYSARLVGVDSETDLAILKIDASGLVYAEWGNSDLLRVGSLVWAVGSPFGLEQSTTQGIVSAKHRRQSERPDSKLHQDLLQSDVAINPGNSGGPLINDRGQVVGINTSIVGEAFCGISFAVPSSVAREVYERIRRSGKVDRSFLGVIPRVVPGQLVSKYGIADGLGAFIERVEPGYAADRAGIHEGDIILSWNEQLVENDITLFRLVGLTRPNSTAKVILLRNGQTIELIVRVDLRSQRL